MGSPPRILLVDDYPDTVRAYAKLLRRDGFEVCIATDCQSARLAAQARGGDAERTFDLLVCDLGLPDGDGCELLRELRASQGLAGIAVTGSGGAEDRRRSREAGFAFHLVKPIQIQDLQAAIHGALQGRHAAQR